MRETFIKPMTTRTARLATLPLVQAKQSELRTVVSTYNASKDIFMVTLASRRMWRYLDNKREFRDAMKNTGAYPAGVNVHPVDQAAFDACETWVRHIESVITLADIKGRIYGSLDGLERYYAYTCLKRYGWIGTILIGGTPKVDSTQLAGLDVRSREQVARYLHRILRKAFSKITNPRAHLKRSLSLDETLYRVFETRTTPPPDHICGDSKRCKASHRRQYVSIVGSKSRQRINLPLAGFSSVKGNIRVVLDKGDDRAYIHTSYEITPKGKATGPDEAIDWGVSEVCTDTKGVKHGDELKQILTDFTEANNRSGKRRGKLHANWRKLTASNPAKARSIAKNNLGTKKQSRRRIKARASVQTVTGCAIKEVVYGAGNRTRAKGAVAQHKNQRPGRLGIEDLAHLRGKAKSKKLSRLCSTWMRAENQARVVVHTSVACSNGIYLNAAYTSQTCPKPTCGYVHAQNRQGDKFHCLNCKWQGDADQVAAMNLKAGITDTEIGTFTSYTKVKEILDGRFQRRKENLTGSVSYMTTGTVTAHGRTPSGPLSKMRVEDSNVDSPSPDTTVVSGETQRLESEYKRRPRVV